MTHTNNTNTNNRVADTVKVAGSIYAIRINWNEEYKEWHIQNKDANEFWQNLNEAIDSAKLLLKRLGDTHRYTVYND